MSKEDQEVLDLVNGINENATEEDSGKKKPAKSGVYIGRFVPRRAEFKRMFGEVAGWAGFGGVVLACMLAGSCPMIVAVPVFCGCFAWVAIRVDRHFRR